MNKTPNYQLNQWEAEDRVLRTDFNADNAKIDAALAGKADVSALAALTDRVTAVEPLASDHTVSGSFEGNSSMDPRTIPLPWEPKLVVMMGKINSNSAIGYVTPDACLYSTGLTYEFGSQFCPTIQGSAIVLRYWFNVGPTYYVAFR